MKIFNIKYSGGEWSMSVESDGGILFHGRGSSVEKMVHGVREACRDKLSKGIADLNLMESARKEFDEISAEDIKKASGL